MICCAPVICHHFASHNTHVPTKKTVLARIPKEGPYKKGNHKFFVFDVICCAHAICHHSASHTSCSDKEERATHNQRKNLQERRDSTQTFSESITSLDQDVVHMCVVISRQSQSSCSDQEDRAEHQVMLTCHDMLVTCDLSSFEH